MQQPSAAQPSIQQVEGLPYRPYNFAHGTPDFNRTGTYAIMSARQNSNHRRHRNRSALDRSRPF
jgi:hypothetical protein